ncbi:MAG TPA: hypothetical protein VK629_20730 [Steroidobacteraceae bacterium]|nr:hypothetical protein [Steroidobacteraceae bacterium]
MRISRVRLVGITAISMAFISISVHAKPIAFANGTTAMAEYGAGTMTEVQAFYAPTYRYSIGGSYLTLQSDNDDRNRDIFYARTNYLPKRWNFEAAQANVFVWGSVGGSRSSETRENAFAWNTGGQIDYETRRVYGSLRTDLNESSEYSHRIDTLQLGLAPYKHDYRTLAVWLVVQGRQYTGGLYDGIEWAGLIRLFKRNVWIEAGLTKDAKLQAMVMVNF